jgi:methylated-DNA-[protein]-cysteine S-methyltransferase
MNNFFIPFHSFFIKVSFLDNKICKIDFVEFAKKSEPTFLSKKVEDFLKGKISRKEIYSFLDFSRCSSFQKIVYRSMISLKAPITYKQLAEKNSSSPRAIGGAMKRNQFLLIVPCHLVISKNGLGGYSALYGVEIKEKLISLEPFFI